MPTVESFQKAKDAKEAHTNGDDPEKIGRTIEDLATEPLEDESGQVLLDFGDQLNLKLAGRKPSESKLKIRSVQRDITGQLGDRSDDEDYAFLVSGRIHSIATPYRRDEGNQCVSKKRVHELTPVDVVRIADARLTLVLALLDEEDGETIEKVGGLLGVE